MKLFKKLLPIAAIGSVAAIVTPLVTSCGASASFTRNYDDEGNPLDFYEPKIPKKAKGEAFTEKNAAEKVYFDDVAKNNKILLDDLLFQQFGKHEDPENDFYSIYPSKISLSATIIKFDSEKKILSLKVKSKGKLIKETMDEWKKTTKTFIDYDVTIIYGEMPVALYPEYIEVGDDLFSFVPNVDLVPYDPNWSIAAKGWEKGVTETGGVEINTSFDYVLNKNSDFTELLELFDIIEFHSHYFSDQEYIEQ